MLQSHWESKKRKGGKGKGERDQEPAKSLSFISQYCLEMDLVGIQDEITKIEPNGHANTRTKHKVSKYPGPP
jgi:hypothetical protein